VTNLARQPHARCLQHEILDSAAWRLERQSEREREVDGGVVITRPRSRGSSAFEFNLQKSRSLSRGQR